MPVSVTGVPAGASESAILTEKLAQKELDYNELQSLFTKYKLKQKVKYEKLREEVTAYIKKNGANVEKENNALTMIRLSEAESKLEEAERRADSLSRELQRRQAQINDHVILIRNMEEQLRARLPLSEAERSERKRMAELVDMDSVHAQMMYKDERIVELNNMILDKERQILDLQEMVREQGEVASSKSKAMKLVQKRFEEIDSVSRRSVGTETDVVLTGGSGSPADRGRGTSSMRTVRGSSPGRAIKGTSPGPGHGKHSHGNASPPPLDPSEGFYDDDEPGSSSFRRKKRVTFDLPPSGAGSVESVAAAAASSAAQQQSASTSASQQRSATSVAEAVLSTSSQHDDADEIAHAIEELTSENEHLRTLMAEQQTEIRELRERLVTTEEDVARGVRESKSAVAKARVVAQARIKDLEDKMSTLNRDMTIQAEQLQTENETLRSTREWEVEENARLREQVAQVREKNKKLAAELDSSVVSNREMEERMLAEQKVMQHMMEDLEDAEGILVQQGEEKEQLFDDIERLKGAIFAQEQFIEVLEADIVIYEEHIGILRESLGASKVDHRDLIRSKAFEAKLKALEEEKQEIARTRHDERLRTKALNAKVRMLEAENEKLVAKVCDMEMKKDGDGEEQTLGDAQQHSETLELQLHEADRRMASMRTDFEQKLSAARQDAERSMRQAELLRDSVDRLQSDLDTVTARSSSERASASPSKEHHDGMENGQTCLPAELDQAQLEEIETLRQKVEDVLQALHDVEQIKNDLGEQITQMGAENFELTQRVEEVTRENQELRQRFDEEMRTELERVQRERDVCHQQAAELDSALEELKLKLHDKDEELRTVHMELETTRSQVTELSSELVSSRSITSSEYVSESVSVQHSSCENTSNSEVSMRSSLEALEEENKRLRSELDLARLSLQETREVQREVSELKAALEEERRQGEVKWQEVCEKLMQSSAGQPDEPGRMSRKTSVDEMHIYLDTYADKCKRLEDELREARTKLQMGGGNPGPHHSDSHVPAERVGALEQALHETKERIQELERELDDRVHESEAIEHKLARMEEELEAAKQKTEQDKTEKKKLKAAVKQLRDKLQQEKQPTETRSCKKEEEVKEATPPVEESVGKVEIQTVQTSAPAAEQASGSAEELQRLRIQLNAADMEARLTGDLNAELEKCIAELEEKVSDVEKEKEEAVRKCAQLEESKEELSREVDILTNMQEEMSFRVEQAEESFNVDELHNKIACLEREVDSLQTDLVLSREQCEETKKDYDQFIQNAEAVRLHMQQNEQAYCDEIRSLSIANEDLRRQLSDTEAEAHRLEEKENEEIVYLRNCLTEARAHLRVMQATADESLLNARMQEETPVMAGSPRPGATSQERESLQRASSATSEAVATVIRENRFSREHSPAALGSRSGWSTAESMSDHSIAAPPVESEHEYSSRVLPQPYESEQEHVHRYGDLVANHHPYRAERAASNYATPSTSDERFEDASATAFTDASGYSMPTVSADDLVVGAEEECVTTDEIVADTTQQSSNMEQHTTMLQAGADLFLENQLLRECVNQTTRMQDDLGDDVEKLSELRMELENAVDALKGEVWSLNGQLKASVLDRENLADRLAVVDSQLIAEKRKTTQLDQELSEQVEMTEKAQRQAAESENESNRRLAECLDMESRREEIEKAYSQLMDYYTQLHASYEALYKSVNSEKVENGTETDLTSSEVDRGATALRLHATYQEQLSVTREQVRMLRDQLKSLAEDILKCDLASLESSLTANLYSIQHALSRVTELITNSAPMEEADLTVVVDTIIRDCGLVDVDGSSPKARLEAICDILKKKMHEVEESRKAIGEQRRVCRALEERLCLMEHEHVGDTTADLARQLASTQSSLREKTFECEELQRSVDELKEAVEELTNSQETQEAAKLATRQADVDALFRANAELAHTNVQLQNEVDELNEERAGQRGGAECVTSEEEQRRREKQRWNEAEIARLHEVERLLNENIEELNQDVEKAGEQIKKLEQELAATKQKLEDAVAEAEWYREGESEKVASGNEVPKETIEDLQKQKAENETEIDRLRDVESLLNRTIKSIEDKLAAAEERVLELEDTLVEEREKVNETAVLAHAPVVGVASTVASASAAAPPSTSDGWGWGEDEETEEAPQLAEDSWGLDGGEKKTESADDKNKEREMELLDARNRAEEAEAELTVLRSVSHSLNEQISLLRGERDEYLEKVEVLEEKVDEEEQKIKELEEALEADKEKIRELEGALEETAGQPAKEEEGEKAEQGGWDDWSDEPSTVELQEKVDERVEIEQLKKVEEGLRDELEERNAKINDLTAEFSARLAEKERIESELRDLIAKLEQRAEQGGEKSAAAADGGEGWSEDWTTDSQTDVSELRNKLELAEDRIATLTLDLEERSRDLLRLQEQNERQRTASRSSISAAPVEEQPVAAPPQPEAANDGWGEAWADDESAPDEENTELESERQGREDAERERDELRETVANLGRQVEELTVRLENYEAQEEEIDEMREELSTLREQLQRARVESEELRRKVEQSETQTKPASSDWGWGEDNDNEVATETESEEVSILRQRAADVEEQLRSALERCDQLEANLVQSSEEQEQTVKDAEELQTSLQSEIDELLQRVRQVEVALDEERGLRERAEEESANGQQREVALDSEIAELKQRLSEAQKELEDSRENNADASEREELNTKIKHLEEQLEQTIKQNGLLKDSEACLIDSVDQYSELAEKYKEEKERLQDVVNQLEAKLVELDSLRSRIYHLESEAESMHAASSADESKALQQRITRLEVEVSHANSAKEALARTLAETQERLQAVQKDRDHIKRLYDELRAKIAARRRAAAAGTPSGLSTGSQGGGGLSRRSSIASTVDHEIPEEPIVERGQSNSPAALQVVHGFGSSFASASSSSQESQLLESYRQLVSDVLTRVEEYLERADTNGRLESLELERVCSRLLSAEERILKQVEVLSDEENSSEMARKKKVKILSSSVEVEKSAAVELSPEAKAGVEPEPEHDVVMNELIVSMAAGDNGEIVVPSEALENGNETNEGKHVELVPGDHGKSDDIEELNDLKKKYLALEDEKEMLEERLAAAEKRIADGNALETETIAAERKAEEVGKELDVLRAHCQRVEAELEEMNKDKKVDVQVSMEKQEMEAEVNALREKVEQLTKENEQVIKERDKHIVRSHNMVYSHEELREEYDDLVRAKNTYLEINDELCRDKMELLMRVRLEVHKRDVLKEENKMLLDRVKQLAEVRGVLETLEARCDSSDLQLQGVLVAAERSEQRANESEEKLAQAEMERDKLAEELGRVDAFKKEELLQAEETKNQMALEKSEVLEEIETASENLQALSEQIAASEMKLTTYEEKLERSAETETLLKEQLAEEVKNAEMEREGLQEAIRELTVEVERWKDVVGEKEASEEQLKGELEQKRVEIEESGERLKKAEERVEELEARVRRAEEEQGNEQQLKGELEQKRAEIEESSDRLKNAEEKVIELEARVRRAEEEQQERVWVMEELGKELENRVGEVVSLQCVIESSACAQRELASRNTSLEERVRDLDTQVAEFELKFAELQRENVEHEQAVQRAVDESAMLEATRVHLKASGDALEAFHKEQLESQNTIRCLQDELSRVQRECHGARETLNDMQMRLAEADSKVGQANERAERATSNERELTKMLQELQEQYASVHRELELCRVNESELRTHADHLKSQLQSTVEKAAAQEAETTVELQQLKDMLLSATTESQAKENELCEQVTVLQAQLAAAEQMCHVLNLEREESITLTNAPMQETISGRSASSQHKVTDEVAHLREDCVHLETQLKDTLEQMQASEDELETVKSRLQSREDALLKLKGQLEELNFENEQMRRSTMNADASARIAELQRELSAQRTAMDERIDVLVDELRVSEEALEEQKMQRVEIERREETSREQAEKWYAEYENVSRELESMMRSIEEVRHLETALAKSREEQEALARQLNEAQDVNQRAQHEKDALNAQLTIVSQLLEERTEKLRQAGEAKTKQTIRMLEIESRMNDWNSVDRGGEGPSTSPRVVGQQSSSQPSMVAVDLTDDHTVLDMDVVGEVGEARQSDNNLQERLRIANERIRQLESRSVGMTSLLFGGEGVETEEEGEAGTLSATGDADTMCDEFLDGKMDESIASRFSVQLSRPRKLSTSESDSENDFQVAVDRLPEKFQRKQKDKTTELHIQLGDLSDIASAASPKSPGAYSSDGSYGLNTSEIPPNIDFYRMTAEKLNHSKSRPSMSDLLDGTIFKKPSSEEKKVEVQISVDDAEKEEKPEKSTERRKFGWIEGVFVRCLQNIIGVILYLRLAWVAGQAGLLLGSLVILLASVVTTITTISTSAITTNGEIKGGGVYYLISRTLGPEFGGSIGLIFYCANAIGAALYLVGFAETVRDLLVDHGIEIFDGGINDVRILGVGLCVALMAIIFIGVSFESKMQQLMMVPFMISVLAYVIGSFIHTETKALRGFTGYSWNTFKSNLVPNFRGETFFTIFSIYFPAATGIMAGANISGDLKNPQMAIPRGTLLAIFASTLIYLGTLFCAGATFVREVDGVNAMQFENGKLFDPNCTASDSCKYGLMNNFQTLTDMSVWGPLITVGIFASTVSSALGSMVSAPKVFQAVASDNLFPYLGFFSKGSGKNNDPRRAYVLSFLITVSMILIGNLNTIAPIISNFFLCSYTLINYACFDASYSETPGFRPAFKFYNMWVSLACSVICVVIMFIMSWVTALMTIFVFAVLYIFLKKHKPDVNWGSSTQANQYKTTLQGLYRMTKYDDHVKNYRPQILLMSGDPSTRPGLVDFAASITRGSSLMVCANVLTHVPTHRVYSMMRRSDLRAHHWLKERGIKSFCGTVSATDLHTGTTSLAQSVGVGKMVPNILMLGYKSDWTKGKCKLPEINAYFKSIQTGFDMNMSVVVLRNRDEGFDVLDAEKRITRASVPLRKGSPPKGRLSLNPEKHGDLFQGGPRQIFKTLKSRASGANIAEMNPTKAEYVQEHFNEEEKTAPRPRRTANGRKLRSCTDMSQVPSPFCVRIKKATIDVWWLSDDGGLTLLLPHLLTLSKSYLEGANLRVFTVSSNEQIESEQASMAALMNKFRIVYKDLHIIADMGGKPHDKTLQTFNTLIEPFLCKSAEPEEGMITEEELKTNKGKTYRQLRCGELLHKHSEDADLLVINLPVPTRGTVSSALYMSWLEMMSRGLPPVLMVRGNHTSVLTFYS